MEGTCIILCGGKCGSCTLHMSTSQFFLKSIRSHTLSKAVKEYINDDDKIYFIDSYRRPLERKISSFFENIDKRFENYKEIPIDKLINIFNNSVIFNIENYHPINEILKENSFKDFNFDKKYNIKTIDNKVFIKLLFSDINNWDKRLGEIFNREVKILGANLSKNKPYNDIYKVFKSKYKCPLKFIKYLEEDKEFKIYNSPEQQKLYINILKKFEGDSLFDELSNI